jgi:hypothetical protein
VRAFRRPLREDEQEPYVELSRRALDEGLSCEQALRRALKAILCAPEFLYLEESPVVGNETRIRNHQLASRLSYFLWSSLPDDELLEVAGRGELARPDVLAAQVERMLQDPKATRFVLRFTGQWLRLDDIDFTVPDVNFYPEYDSLLRQSMLDETRAFLRQLLDHDLAERNLIDSDFLMINEPLALFYGISGVEGLAIRRVSLPPDSERGGVLTQAAVLKVSADGTRTSPVLRGAWILKHLYGIPPPPPPATIKAVEPDIRGVTTIREQLAKHRNHDSCQRCHSRIDPPGFALESFDVIGAYRQWYRTREGKHLDIPRHPQSPKQHVLFCQGPDVDPSGTLADGRPFSDIRQYRRLLLEDDTALTKALVDRLLTYSLGRHLGFSDRAEIDRIVGSLKARDFGLRSMVHAVIQCELFQEP